MNRFNVRTRLLVLVIAAIAVALWNFNRIGFSYSTTLGYLAWTVLGLSVLASGVWIARGNYLLLSPALRLTTGASEGECQRSERFRARAAKTPFIDWALAKAGRPSGRIGMARI
jgi:hypothetical protein